MKKTNNFKLEEMSRGGSCIAEPLGELIAEPVYGEERTSFELQISR